NDAIELRKTGEEVGRLFKAPVAWYRQDTKLEAARACDILIEYKQSIPDCYKRNNKLFLRMFMMQLSDKLGTQSTRGIEFCDPWVDENIYDLKFMARSLGLDFRKHDNVWMLMGNLFVLFKQPYTSTDTTWTYTYIGYGKYYGFTLTGDGRYLLDS